MTSTPQTVDPAEVLGQIEDRAQAPERVENEVEDLDLAGKNYAFTLVPSRLHRAVEESQRDVEPLVKALRAVLDLAGVVDPDGRREYLGSLTPTMVRTAITTALTEVTR